MVISYKFTIFHVFNNTRIVPVLFIFCLFTGGDSKTSINFLNFVSKEGLWCS